MEKCARPNERRRIYRALTVVMRFGLAPASEQSRQVPGEAIRKIAGRLVSPSAQTIKKKDPVVEEYSRIAQEYNIEWSFYVETTRKQWRSSSSRLTECGPLEPPGRCPLC